MKATTKEKRAVLSEISRAVKQLVESGEYTCVNQAIIETIYKRDGHYDFKTFQEWKQQGFKVKKGEKAFIVWGKPLASRKSEEEQEDENQRHFFPLCFLFSAKQVTKIEPAETE